MDLNTKGLIAAGLALLAVIGGGVAMTGAWATWKVNAGGFSGGIDYGLQEADSNFGSGRGAAGTQSYTEDRGPDDLLDWTTGLLITAIAAGGLAVLVLGAFAANLIPAPFAGRTAWVGVGLALLAGLLLITAPIVVAIGFPRSLSDTGTAASGPDPTDSFWGSNPGLSWGAGWAWYVSLVAGVLGVAATVAGTLAARAHRPSATAERPTMA